MSNGKAALMHPEVTSARRPGRVVGPQSPHEHSDTETYFGTNNALGTVFFKLSELNVKGSSQAIADPSQSQYIVASDEEFTVSVKVEFNQSPLSKLLMCLGTTVTANFGFEGFGARAIETDAPASLVTTADVYEYTIEWTGTAQDLSPALTPGLYEIGATITVGPANHKCSPPILGYGYIEEILLQIYQV